MKIYIHCNYSEYNKTFEFSASSVDTTKYGNAFLVEECELEFTEPTYAVLSTLEIQRLRLKKANLNLMAAEAATKIEESIQSLLCLENKA